MKHEITKMTNPPTTVEEMKKVLKELQDQGNLEDQRYLTHRCDISTKEDLT